MLKPAIIYKTEIEQKFAELLYTDEYFYYSGYAHSNSRLEVKAEDNIYQYAIIDKDEVVGWLACRVVGWFAYRVQPETDTVYNFGLYSFDKGNPVIGVDVFRKMEELVNTFRRVEWRMISDNPIERHYDRFCQRHKGNKVVLHDVTKDNHGRYHDECIYEIINRPSSKHQSLKEKDEPKAVRYEGDGYADGAMVYDMAFCSNCEHEFEEDSENWECEFCPNCGQRLRW